VEPSAFVSHSAALEPSAVHRAESVVPAAERLAAEGKAAVAPFIVVPMIVDDVRVVEFVEPVAVDIDLAAAPVEAAP
jgi:hypothetical protein